jgi:hypothetical protein
MKVCTDRFAFIKNDGVDGRCGHRIVLQLHDEQLMGKVFSFANNRNPEEQRQRFCASRRNPFIKVDGYRLYIELVCTANISLPADYVETHHQRVLEILRDMGRYALTNIIRTKERQLIADIGYTGSNINDVDDLVELDIE